MGRILVLYGGRTGRTVKDLYWEESLRSQTKCQENGYPLGGLPKWATKRTQQNSRVSASGKLGEQFGERSSWSEGMRQDRERVGEMQRNRSAVLVHKPGWGGCCEKATMWINFIGDLKGVWGPNLNSASTHSQALCWGLVYRNHAQFLSLRLGMVCGIGSVEDISLT